MLVEFRDRGVREEHDRDHARPLDPLPDRRHDPRHVRGQARREGAGRPSSPRTRGIRTRSSCSASLPEVGVRFSREAARRASRDGRRRSSTRRRAAGSATAARSRSRSAPRSRRSSRSRPVGTPRAGRRPPDAPARRRHEGVQDRHVRRDGGHRRLGRELRRPAGRDRVADRRERQRQDDGRQDDPSPDARAPTARSRSTARTCRRSVAASCAATTDTSRGSSRIRSARTTRSSRSTACFEMIRSELPLRADRRRVEQAEAARRSRRSGSSRADVLGKYPHQLSGGQLQRLLIARALMLDIEFLVADEIISMLDASTRIDVLNLLGDLKERGLGVLFVTHDLALGNYISDRVVILRRGRIVEMGPTPKVFANPVHPYTQMLLASVPQLTAKWEETPRNFDEAAAPVTLQLVDDDHFVDEVTTTTCRRHAPLALSFMSANYVASELGYGAADEWGPFDEATNAAFEPLETFAEPLRRGARDDRRRRLRRDRPLVRRTSTGAGRPPSTSRIAREALDSPRPSRRLPRRQLRLRRPPSSAAACRLANDLDVDLLGGSARSCAAIAPDAAAVLRDHGVRFGLENHPEKTPQEVLERSATTPTCSARQSTPAGGRRSRTTRSPRSASSRDRLFHVHLKDVEAPGTHVSCMHGDGCANIAGCVERLLEIGYVGPAEHRARALRPRPHGRVRPHARAHPGAARRDGRSTPCLSRLLRVAVVGCGNISGAYGETMGAYPTVEIAGATDVDRALSAAFVERFGGVDYPSLDDVLDDSRRRRDREPHVTRRPRGGDDGAPSRPASTCTARSRSPATTRAHARSSSSRPTEGSASRARRSRSWARRRRRCGGSSRVARSAPSGSPTRR